MIIALHFLFYFPYKVVAHANLRVSARVYDAKCGALFFFFSKNRLFLLQHMGLRRSHAYGLRPRSWLLISPMLCDPVSMEGWKLSPGLRYIFVTKKMF